MMTNFSFLREYVVQMDVTMLAHDEEEALEITKAIKACIEKCRYKVEVDVAYEIEEA